MHAGTTLPSMVPPSPPPPTPARPSQPVSPLGIIALAAGTIVLLIVVALLAIGLYVARESSSTDGLHAEVTSCTTEPGDQFDTVIIDYAITNRQRYARTVFVEIEAFDSTGDSLFTTVVAGANMAPGQTVTGRTTEVLFQDRVVDHCAVKRVQ